MTLDENTTLQGTDDSQHEPPTPDIKITKWNDLTDDQKSDIEFLKAQKTKYEQDVENYENDTNYKKFTKKIDAITKAPFPC